MNENEFDTETENHAAATTPELPPPPDAPASDAADPRKTIEAWRDELATPAWLFAGMKLGKRWPIGKEVRRAEYEAAVHWAKNIECR